MTMIVALANDQHVIQISDRRLSCDGELVDDEVNKATFLECDDVCAIIGFTGLARYKKFDVQEWLLETLYKCPHTNFLDICDYIASEGTALFNTHHVLKYTSKAVKKLTFMLTGFRNDGLIVNAIISNYQCTKTLTDSAECFDEFRVLPLINSVDNSKSSTFVQRIGAWDAFPKEEEIPLRTMLAEKKDRKAIVDKTAGIIRKISDSKASCGSVGKQLNVVTLTPGSNAPLCNYLSETLKCERFQPDHVVKKSNGPSIMIKDFKIESNSPLVIPKVHRNAPCPCGSGTKYRFCCRG